MDNFISRLSFVFCLALILFYPVVLRADEAPKGVYDVDFKIIVNTIGGDGVFNINIGANPGVGTPANFQIATTDGRGEYDFLWRNSEVNFNISQTLPAGWKKISFDCTNTQSPTAFAAHDNGVGVSISRGDNNITCAITDEYREEWLQDNFNGYFTVNTNTINGDETFDYTVFNNAGPTFPPGNFTVTTANGSGMSQYVWAGDSYRFSLTQFHPDGWQPVSLFCQDTNPGAKFEYDLGYHNSVTITINRGYNRITCTFTNKNTAKTPVLFVPGMLSTEINKDQVKIWPDPLRMLGDNSFMDVMGFDNDMKALNNNIYYKDVIKRELNFYDYTDSLIKEFASQGYEESKYFFLFPYDWRYGVTGTYPDGKTNAQLLAEKIAQIRQQTGSDKINVIAHSLGGLIVKKYVMDTAAPKIDKLVFVAVPNLGSPLADKALLMGHSFNVLGLLPEEVKKISQNMPLAYDLLPSQTYYDIKGSYIKTVSANYLQPETKNLDQNETKTYLINKGLNSTAIKNADDLHSLVFDSYDVRQKGIDAYNITGCKSGTIQGIKDQKRSDGLSAYYPLGEFNGSGDDTVPFESADSIKADDNKKFYALKAGHGDMPSENGVRQKIVNILTGSLLDEGSNIISRVDLQEDKSKCELWGKEIVIKSPLDIVVTDAANNRLGFAANGSVQDDIPGASFEVFDGHKYVYLPAGDGETYSISLKGTGDGSFTLIESDIEANKTVAAYIFNDIPVSSDYAANLDITGDLPIITDNNGVVLHPTAAVDGNAANDTDTPVTTAVLAGDQGAAGFYRSDVTVNLSAQDALSEDDAPSGVISVSYSIDEGAVMSIVDDGLSLSIDSEGNHTVKFFAKDKLGNTEEEKSVNFTIDKTAPTMGLDPASGTFNAPFSFKWNIYDGITGVNSSSCNVRVDNAMVSTSCSGSYQLGIGSHVVVASAADNADNIGSDTRNYAVNSADAGTLVINKKAGTASANFNFSLAGNATSTINIATINGSGTSGNLALPAGQYILSEVVPVGWKLTGTACSSVCAGSFCSTSVSNRNGVISFKMVKNLKLTCTFTNTKR